MPEDFPPFLFKKNKSTKKGIPCKNGKTAHSKRFIQSGNPVGQFKKLMKAFFPYFLVLSNCSIYPFKQLWEIYD